MTPNELYKREPEKITKDLGILVGCYYNHIPELEEFNKDWNSWTELNNNELIEIHFYKYFAFDHRRFWSLGAVKFKNDFVMIIQNAGREGDDYTDRFITNESAYYEMVNYIKTLFSNNITEESKDDIVSPDDNINTLLKFYGNELDGYFERY